jgi:hypothetical protein
MIWMLHSGPVPGSTSQCQAHWAPRLHLTFQPLQHSSKSQLPQASAQGFAALWQAPLIPLVAECIRPLQYPSSRHSLCEEERDNCCLTNYTHSSPPPLGHFQPWWRVPHVDMWVLHLAALSLQFGYPAILFTSQSSHLTASHNQQPGTARCSNNKGSSTPQPATQASSKQLRQHRIPMSNTEWPAANHHSPVTLC